MDIEDRRKMAQVDAAVGRGDEAYLRQLGWRGPEDARRGWWPRRPGSRDSR